MTRACVLAQAAHKQKCTGANDRWKRKLAEDLDLDSESEEEDDEDTQSAQRRQGARPRLEPAHPLLRRR